MKRLQLRIACIYLLFVVLTIRTSHCQELQEGRMVTVRFHAPAIAGNTGNENPERRLSIYLPPGYDTSKKRYPVIYFLHGFGVNDSLMTVWLQLKDVMDRAIAEKRIAPMLLVAPDSESRYFGGFYTNSGVNGKWGDFIAHDVVKYIDSRYRTLARKESRGIFGHSMGGNGVMRIVMQYPDLFNAAYALSPGALHWNGEFNLDNPAFRLLGQMTNESEIRKVDDNPTVNPNQFWVVLFAALGRSFSPDVNAKPFMGRLPVTYTGKQRHVNVDVLQRWEKQFPINMAHLHLDALTSLNGLKIDWGRNDEFPHIPATCRELSLRLEALGVPHEAEEYIGGHHNKIGGPSGRISTAVLPFFATLLEIQ